MRVQGPHQGGEGEGEEEGAAAHLQERPPHLLRLLHALRRLRLHVQAPVIHQHGAILLCQSSEMTFRYLRILHWAKKDGQHTTYNSNIDTTIAMHSWVKFFLFIANANLQTYISSGYTVHK